MELAGAVRLGGVGGAAEFTASRQMAFESATAHTLGVSVDDVRVTSVTDVESRRRALASAGGLLEVEFAAAGFESEAAASASANTLQAAVSSGGYANALAAEDASLSGATAELTRTAVVEAPPLPPPPPSPPPPAPQPLPSSPQLVPSPEPSPEEASSTGGGLGPWAIPVLVVCLSISA